MPVILFSSPIYCHVPTLPCLRLHEIAHLPGFHGPIFEAWDLRHGRNAGAAGHRNGGIFWGPKRRTKAKSSFSEGAHELLTCSLMLTGRSYTWNLPNRK